MKNSIWELITAAVNRTGGKNRTVAQMKANKKNIRTSCNSKMSYRNWRRI